MNILDQIINKKKQEIAERKAEMSVQDLEKSNLFLKESYPIKTFLIDPERTGIIAEFKRKSPSKGVINDKANVMSVINAYNKHGASAISILTDETFFGGNINDLKIASTVDIPLLRKDFMIDEYQLIEAKAYGASVILLIASCLSALQVKELARQAKNIGLEVLLEIHNKSELNHICDEVDLVGINNRDLKTFNVSIETSLELISEIPKNKIAVAESGISEVNTIVMLKKAGFKGFLIGEQFMKYPDPTIAFADFVDKLKAAYES